jgi:hypothetical protein
VERATAGLRLTKDEAEVRVKKAPIHRLFRRYDPSNHPLDSLKTHKKYVAVFRMLLHRQQQHLILPDHGEK